LNPSQFERIKKALGVEILSGPGGKLIDIAGDSEESVHQARTRLKIMLDTKVRNSKKCFSIVRANWC